MASETVASRTLVKSPPELWAEVSDQESLGRHLGELGEIRITRVEPEHTVAWEGESVRGTVRLEPAGWGTKVTLTAEAATELQQEATGAGVHGGIAAAGGATEGPTDLQDGVDG